MRKHLSQTDMETKVSSIVNVLVNDGEMFTAFDVTKKIREEGIWAEHSDVRAIVHGMFELGDLSGTGYARTLVPIPGKIPAFCYHLHTDDPDDYVPGANAVVSPANVSPPTGSKKDDDAGVVCYRDNLRRLNTPNKHVYAVGLKPGDVAKVFSVKGEFQIFPAGCGPFDDHTQYIVNCKGNVRISGSLLDSVSKSDEFISKVSVDGSHIKIFSV